MHAYLPDIKNKRRGGGRGGKLFVECCVCLLAMKFPIEWDTSYVKEISFTFYEVNKHNDVQLAREFRMEVK